MKRRSTAWVFVSHSTRDLEKVRHVRNALEKAGAEPVLFFLKCLSDHDEIDDLIKREIEARAFFLLCESANARNSKWVQDEVTHVRSLSGRQIEVIDLDSDWEAQLDGITRLIRKATAFFSFSLSDRQWVEPVRAALAARDFSTWDDIHDIGAGDSWGNLVKIAIEDAARHGYFLHFLSTQSLRSRYVSKEVEIAFRAGIKGRYIPILLEPPDIIGPLIPIALHERQWLDYSDKNLDRLLEHLLPALGIGNIQVQD